MIGSELSRYHQGTPRWVPVSLCIGRRQDDGSRSADHLHRANSDKVPEIQVAVVAVIPDNSLLTVLCVDAGLVVVVVL